MEIEQGARTDFGHKEDSDLLLNGKRTEPHAQSLEPRPRLETLDSNDSFRESLEDVGNEGNPPAFNKPKPVENGHLHRLRTIKDRPGQVLSDKQSEDQPVYQFDGTGDMLETYSKELILSNFPLVDSDVFPANKRKGRGNQIQFKVPKQLADRRKLSHRSPLGSAIRLRRVGTSPYDIAWSQRMLERHFHVHLQSSTHVFRVHLRNTSPETHRKARN